MITANGLLKYSIYLFYILLITAFSLKTIARNKDWKNDFQLFTNDVNYAPNSAKLLELSAIFNYFYNPSFPNGTIPNVAIRNESILKLKQSIEILPNTFPESYAYLTYIYLSIDSVDQAYAVYNDVTHKGMATPQLTDLKQRICEAYLTKGDSCFIHKDADCAIANFKKAIDVNPANARAWWNYGGISYEKGNKAATIEAWEKVLLLNPEYPKAKELLQQVKMSPDSKP